MRWPMPAFRASVMAKNMELPSSSAARSTERLVGSVRVSEETVGYVAVASTATVILVGNQRSGEL